MPESRTIFTPADGERLVQYLNGLRMPFTVTVKDGKPKTNPQNRLQRKWCAEVEMQRGDVDAEWVRGFSKGMFGVPIMCRDDEAYAEKYEKMMKPLPFETKIAFLCEPFDFAVTRLMTRAQKQEYLDKMYAYWTKQGFILTKPEDRK